MIIMVIEISNYLARVEASQYSIFTQKFHFSVSKTLKKFNGDIKKTDNNNYLVCFTSVSDAVFCAQEVQYKFKYVTPKHQSFNRRLNIALVASKKFTKKDILTVTRMCEIVKNQLVISEEVKSLYESENEKAEIDQQLIRVLNSEEEKFLLKIMDHLESKWARPEFDVLTFSKAMGYSYSQFYRRLINLSGKSPNNFIKEFRLHKALEFLHAQKGSISQIATKTGFNSSTYFSTCFLDKYGIRPSKYVQQHT